MAGAIPSEPAAAARGPNIRIAPKAKISRASDKPTRSIKTPRKHRKSPCKRVQCWREQPNIEIAIEEDVIDHVAFLLWASLPCNFFWALLPADHAAHRAPAFPGHCNRGSVPPVPPPLPPPPPNPPPLPPPPPPTPTPTPPPPPPPHTHAPPPPPPPPPPIQRMPRTNSFARLNVGKIWSHDRNRPDHDAYDVFRCAGFVGEGKRAGALFV